MPLALRPLLCILLLSMGMSCGTTGDKTNEPPLNDTLQHPANVAGQHQRNQLTEGMLEQILAYYKKEYGGDSVYMNVTRTDTIVEVSFADTTGGPDDYKGTLFVAYISLVKDIKSTVAGDVNGDGKDDLLVTVHTEGGGGGGNVWWGDHFLFVGEEQGGYKLKDVKSDNQLLGDDVGYLSPDSISGQMVTAVANTYTEGDGHCCPSLYYRIHLMLKEGKLTFVDKTAIEKPANF